MRNHQAFTDKLHSRIEVLDIMLLFFALMIVFRYEAGLRWTAAGVDLYQYWGVGQVLRLTQGEISNPYDMHEEFNRILAEEAAKTSDPVHKKVADYRKDLELQGTPFSYFIFSWLPSKYEETRSLYRAMQIGIFTLITCGLLYSVGYTWWRSLLASLLILPFYNPMKSELIVGNFNTILTAGLAVGFYLSNKLVSMHFDRDNVDSLLPKATALLVWIGMFTLMKPTLTIMFLIFVLFLAARFGIFFAAKATLLSVFPLGLIGSLPALRFGSATIWYEWFRYFRSGNLDMMNLPLSQGNVSTTLFLSKNLGIPLGICIGMLTVLLIGTLLLKAKQSESLKTGLHVHLADPHFIIALGVVATLALSPLAWIHYFVIIIVPAVILLHSRHRRTIAPKLAVLSIIMVTIPSTSFSFRYLIMLSWVPLWCAALTLCPLQIDKVKSKNFIENPNI